jgi:thymidylate kinase
MFENKEVIFLEGIDGSGKTSVYNFLQSNSKNLFFKNYPKPCKDLLTITKKTNPEASLFLFLADLKMGEEDIDHYLNSVNKGAVITDRSWLSTLAYQKETLSKKLYEIEVNKRKVYIEDTDKDVYPFVENYCFNSCLIPDVVILFDIDPKTAIKRCIDRSGGKGTPRPEDINFLSRVRNNYKKYSNHPAFKMEIINTSSMKLEKVIDRVVKIIAG